MIKFFNTNALFFLFFLVFFCLVVVIQFWLIKWLSGMDF